MIFEKLPDVQKCCCFLPLKAGTVFIAFMFMVLSVANNKLQLKDVEGYECYSGVLDAGCPVHKEMTYVTDATIFVAFMYFLPSAFLVVGVLKNSRKIVTAFLYFVSLSILIAETIDWTVLIIGVALSPCGTPNETRIRCVIGDTVFLIVSIYFLIVVKSFRKTMVIQVNRSTMAFQTPHKHNEKIHVHVSNTRGAIKKPSLYKFTSGESTSALRYSSSKSSSDDYIPRSTRPRLKSSATSSKQLGPQLGPVEKFQGRKKSSLAGTTSSSDGKREYSTMYSSTDTV